MKVFIVSDMEGVAGIVKWQQVSGGHAMYEEGAPPLHRRDQRGRSRREGGRCDRDRRHGLPRRRRRLDVQLADPGGARPRVRVRRAERVDGVHRVPRGGVDAALFVGMHAMAGTRDGVLAHTVSGSSWWRLRFNGVEVGETGINAALCGTWGCPVLLVTGDEAACREGKELLGAGLTTVAVKKGLGRFSARQFRAEGTRPDRGRARGTRLKTSPPWHRTTRGSHARSPSTSTPRTTSRSYRFRAGRRDHRAAPDRLARGRLVVGLAAVLLERR